MNLKRKTHFRITLHEQTCDGQKTKWSSPAQNKSEMNTKHGVSQRQKKVKKKSSYFTVRWGQVITTSPSNNVYTKMYFIFVEK